MIQSSAPEEIDIDLTSQRDLSAHPIPKPDGRAIVYDLPRPELDPLPGKPGDGQSCNSNKSFKDWVIDTLVSQLYPESLSAGTEAWLRELNDDVLKETYDHLSLQLVNANSMIVDFNDALAIFMGSNIAAYLMGSEEQSRNACFYLTKYFAKEKAPLEECIIVFKKAREHIQSYPSTADDSGTKKRTALHWCTRILNQLNKKLEMSDTQAAAANLGLPFESSTESFSYIDIHATIRQIQEQRKLLAEVNTEEEEEEEEEGDFDEDVASYNDIALPEIDESAGCCRFYRVPALDEDSAEDYKMVPVLQETHYQHRGKSLHGFSRVEFFSLFRVQEKKKKKSDGNHENDNSVYDFEPITIGSHTLHHPLQGTHEIFQMNKQTTIVSCGKSVPKHPGQMHESGRDPKSWRKAADYFAAFFLVAFMPNAGCLTDSDPLDWSRFCQVVATMEESASFLDQSRLQLMEQWAHGLDLPRKKRVLLNEHRTQCATRWDDQEKKDAKEYFSSKGMDDMTKGGVDEADEHVENGQYVELSQRDIRAARERIAYSTSQRARVRNLMGAPAAATALVAVDPKLPPVLNMSSAKVVDSDRQVKETVVNDYWDEDDSEHASDEEPAAAADRPKSADSCVPADHSSSLNDEQRSCFETFKEYFDSIGTPLNRPSPMPPQKLEMVNGGAGVGKTTLTKAITKYAKHKKVGQVSFSAPTGLTASLGNGNTVHTTFQFQNNFNKSDEDDKAASAKQQSTAAIPHLNDKGMQAMGQHLNPCKIVLLIIDEISMINPVQLETINCRMQQLMGNQLPFGGVSVLLVGDFSQIPPVSGTSLFKAVMENAIKKRGMKRDFSAFKRGADLFQRHHLTSLTVQQRSKDAAQTDLVTRMGRGESLTPRDLKNIKRLSRDDCKETKWKISPIVVATNKEVFDLTEDRAVNFACIHGTVVIKWKKTTKNWKNQPDLELFGSEVYEDPALWEYFVQGAPSFISSNLNTAMKICNGTQVKLHSVTLADAAANFELNDKISKSSPGTVIELEDPPISVNVHLYLDDEEQQERATKFGMTSLVEDDFVVAIRKGGFAKYHTIDLNGGDWYGVSKVSVQNIFPLEFGLVMTYHKCQGRTLPSLIINLAHMPPSMRQNEVKHHTLFVALSRVADTEAMRILCGPNEDMSYLCHLESSPYLRAWRKGFTNGQGLWNEQDATSAYYLMQKRKKQILDVKGSRSPLFNKRKKSSRSKCSGGPGEDQHVRKKAKVVKTSASVANVEESVLRPRKKRRIASKSQACTAGRCVEQRQQEGGTPSARVVAGRPGQKIANPLSNYRRKIIDLGFQIVEVPRDGNCFYSSLAHALGGGQTQADVRELVFRRLADDSLLVAEISPFLPDHFPVQQLANDVRTGGVWGGDYELHVIQRVIMRDIVIFDYIDNPLPSMRVHVRQLQRMVEISENCDFDVYCQKHHSQVIEALCPIFLLRSHSHYELLREI